MKTPSSHFSRRDFFKTTAALAAVSLVQPTSLWAANRSKRTAVDLVPLGKTGLKMSRLGIGTGTHAGTVHRGMGQAAFTKLIRHAYERGITYIDTAEMYGTHEMVREAIKGLPREKLFILTKIPDAPEKPAEVLDRYRKELGTDYFDVVLSHCAIAPDWDDQRRRVLDCLHESKDKQILRAHGVSCHGLPSLNRSTKVKDLDVHLVRLNPQGRHIDAVVDHWSPGQNEPTLSEVEKQVKAMRSKGRGIIGMKIFGNGEFKEKADREKSVRYAISSGLMDSMTIGLASIAEVDEAIEMIDRAYAEMS